MFSGIKKLLKYKILAKDGEIGKIEDFYFDERFHTVRYLVVKTGGVLFKNEVLISPVFIQEVLDYEKLVRVTLTKDEIEHSPDIDTDKPVSRLYEKEFYRYYGAAPYWSGYLSWGSVPIPVDAKNEEEMPEGAVKPEEEEHEHFLRSANEVFGYKCETKDGKMGYIKDFRIDLKTWRIETFLMSAKHFSERDEIEVDMRWIKRFDYPDKKIRLDMAVKETEKISS